MKIEKTSDYKQFKVLNDNRLTKPQHLLNLIKSVKTKNLLPYSPIIVNEKFEVIDGQHRLAVAKELGLEVHFIKAPGLTIQEVILLNNNLLQWEIDDYLKTYLAQGLKSYEILKEFREKYNLKVYMALAILNLSEDNYPVAKSKLFRAGKFEVRDLDYSTEFMDEFYVPLRQLVDYSIWLDREFLRASAKVYKSEETTPEELLKKVKESATGFMRRATEIDYLRQWEDIWNHKRSLRLVRLY